MENNNRNNLKEGIMRTIKSGAVGMRPRWHFILRMTLVATGAAIVLIGLLYLAGFIFFSLRQTGAWFAPGFGPRGWLALFRELPWLLILLAILFFSLLELLVKRHAFAYRQPLLYSALALVAVALIGGHLVSRSPFEAQWMRGMHGGQPPFPGRYAPNLRMPHAIHQGTIIATTTDGFILEDVLGSTSTVFLTPRSLQPGEKLVVGNTVVVLGAEPATNTIRAFRVRLIPE